MKGIRSRPVARRAADRRGRHRCPVCLGLSGDLSAAPAGPKLARRDPAPPWQWVFFLAFVGVRGVVSLAAALAISVDHAGRRAVCLPRSYSLRDFRSFGPGDVKSPRVGHAAELTLLSVVGAEAATLCCQKER
jgi:hypothetical protein